LVSFAKKKIPLARNSNGIRDNTPYLLPAAGRNFREEGFLTLPVFFLSVAVFWAGTAFLEGTDFLEGAAFLAAGTLYKVEKTMPSEKIRTAQATAERISAFLKGERNTAATGAGTLCSSDTRASAAGTGTVFSVAAFFRAREYLLSRISCMFFSNLWVFPIDTPEYKTLR
jgi:hypothetical protein